MSISRIFIAIALTLTGSLFAEGNGPHKADTAGAFYNGQINGVNYYLSNHGIAFIGDAFSDYANVQMVWEGANEDIYIYGLDNDGNQREIGSSNALNGEVAQVVYENIYFNIDLVVYPVTAGNQALRYEFIVYPGGDPSQISLHYKDGKMNSIRRDGSLDIATATGHMSLSAPVAFQEAAGSERNIVSTQFSIANNRLQLVPNRYEQAQVLVLSCDQHMNIVGTHSYRSGSMK